MISGRPVARAGAGAVAAFAAALLATGPRADAGAPVLETVGSAMQFALDACLTSAADPAAVAERARAGGLLALPDRGAYYSAVTGLPPTGEDPGLVERFAEAGAVAESYFAVPAPAGVRAEGTLLVSRARASASCLLDARIRRPLRNPSSFRRLAEEVLAARGIASHCFEATGEDTLTALRGWSLRPVAARPGCGQSDGLAERMCCWLDVSYEAGAGPARLRALVHLGGSGS